MGFNSGFKGLTLGKTSTGNFEYFRL